MAALKRVVFVKMTLSLCLLILAAIVGRAATVTFAWYPPKETNIVEYRLYYGVSSRNYQGFQSSGTNINLGGTNISYVVTNLLSSSRYYFALAAVNKFTNQSAFSAEIVVDTPIEAPQGFRVISTDLQGAINAASPWETLATLLYVIPTNSQYTIFRSVTPIVKP